MDATAGYVLVSATGLATAAGSALMTWRMSARHAKAVNAILTATPPCIDCGQPTESRRMAQCDQCHARACTAQFRAHAASLGVKADRPHSN